LLQHAKKGRDFPGLVEAVQCSMHIHGFMHETCTSWYICSLMLWHAWWIYPHRDAWTNTYYVRVPMYLSGATSFRSQAVRTSILTAPLRANATIHRATMAPTMAT